MSKLNTFLATEVMGWGEPMTDEPHPYDIYYFPAVGGIAPVMYVEDWNPSENIEQAVMCYTETLKWIYYGDIASDESGHTVTLVIDPAKREAISSNNKKLEKALSLACARARGFKDD